MSSALPRFVGPARVRERMRLAAALGMLAIAAITTGALAGLNAARRVQPEAQPTPTNTATPDLPHMLDPTSLVEHRVEQAEQATTRARAALRSARQLGVVDHRHLDELEQRLDLASGRTPPPSTEAPARTHTVSSGSLETRPREL